VLVRENQILPDEEPRSAAVGQLDLADLALEYRQPLKEDRRVKKLRIELDYLSRRTVGGDMRILAQTAAALLRGPHATDRRLL